MNTFPVIVKSNELIEARYKLSLNQQRLVLLLISIIKPEDEDFQDYQLKVSDFAAMFGIKNCKAIYSEVEQAAAELVGKVINLRQGRERECVAWLSYGKYRQGEGVITIRFDKSLKPYLLQLKSHFTRYQLNTVVKFKSQYSIRLYELLKEFEYLGHGGAFYRIIGIEELKGLFGINNGEYEKMHDLKKRVIDPSVNEVSLYSDIFITQVEYVKEGNRVASVKFTAESKTPELAIEKTDAEQVQPAEAKPAEHVEALLNLGIAGATAKQWAKQYGKKKIMAACGYVAAKLETAAIKDLPAYLAKTLEHDYHLAWMKENQEKQAKKADETERKAGEEAAEQQRRQAAIQKIHDTLSAFHALREGEQDAWRDRFEAEYHSLTMKHWKKYRKEGRQPEDNKMFSGVFSEFFDSMQAV
jgi:plasmid replication initiation protein